LRRSVLSTPAKTLLTTMDLREDAHGLKIMFGRCFEAHFGLRLRDGESRRCLTRASADHLAAWNEVDQELMIPFEHAASARSVLVPRLAEALPEIARRPLTPRLLLTALNITTRERLRWTKDGRLPLAGRVQVRRGAVFSVPTYAVSFVERLAGCPDILSTWRDQDAAEGRAE
jgi:hypothetical protein